MVSLVLGINEKKKQTNKQTNKQSKTHCIYRKQSKHVIIIILCQVSYILVRKKKVMCVLIRKIKISPPISSIFKARTGNSPATAQFRATEAVRSMHFLSIHNQSKIFCIVGYFLSLTSAVRFPFVTQINRQYK